jgi:hypothetical protein
MIWSTLTAKHEHFWQGYQLSMAAAALCLQALLHSGRLQSNQDWHQVFQAEVDYLANNRNNLPDLCLPNARSDPMQPSNPSCSQQATGPAATGGSNGAAAAAGNAPTPGQVRPCLNLALQPSCPISSSTTTTTTNGGALLGLAKASNASAAFAGHNFNTILQKSEAFPNQEMLAAAGAGAVGLNPKARAPGSPESQSSGGVVSTYGGYRVGPPVGLQLATDQGMNSSSHGPAGK